VISHRAAVSVLMSSFYWKLVSQFGTFVDCRPHFLFLYSNILNTIFSILYPIYSIPRLAGAQRPLHELLRKMHIRQFVLVTIVIALPRRIVAAGKALMVVVAATRDHLILYSGSIAENPIGYMPPLGYQSLPLSPTYYHLIPYP
jgi:hypothetical protein